MSLGSPKNRLADALSGILQVELKWLDRAFTLAALAFVLLLLVISLDYERGSGLFPQVVGVATAVLLLIQLAIQSSGTVLRLIGALSPVNFDLSGIHSMDEEVDVDDRRDYGTTFLWLLGLFAVVLLVGFTYGILVFLLAYYRLEADRGWLTTVVYSLVGWGLVIVVFDWFVRVPFYEGLLP